jgi:hypothetical protein
LVIISSKQPQTDAEENPGQPAQEKKGFEQQHHGLQKPVADGQGDQD